MMMNGFHGIPAEDRLLFIEYSEGGLQNEFVLPTSVFIHP